MEQVQEGIHDAEEIGSVLARGLGGADVMDDEELLAELNEMEQVQRVESSSRASELTIRFFCRMSSRPRCLRSPVCLPASRPVWNSLWHPAVQSTRLGQLLQLRMMRTPGHFGNSRRQ
jgi:hypothetical protein